MVLVVPNASSTTPEKAARRIRTEIAMWANVIDEAHVKPDLVDALHANEPGQCANVVEVMPAG